MYCVIFIHYTTAVTLCHSLPFVVTRCHSLGHSLSLFVIRCSTCCHSLSFVLTRCSNRCHSLSRDVPLVCLFLKDLLNAPLYFEMYRTSRSQMFFKIGVLKNFTIFTGKHLSWKLFLIKLQAFQSSGLQLY